MAARTFAFALLSCMLALAGCDPGTPIRRGDGGDGSTPSVDADGDTISDAHEGRAERRDTDGDGVLDADDPDSDGDFIADVREAGDADPGSPPADSDGDGTPNFIDLDSDGNGILDADEVDSDVEGDGLENYADLDDDGDNLSDTQELALGAPADADMDGRPDFQDRDSDNDTIADGDERMVDTDGDLTRDSSDLDSDDDGAPDSVEAGDADLTTPPVDTDDDRTPDFRDPDSDNDGLSDHDEYVTHMTSTTVADSDGDGISDLIEVGAGTNPSDSADSPRTRGDFVFVVPYMEPPDPARDTLHFRTSIAFADVYFLFDISTSMDGEIAALRDAVTAITGNLTCTDTGFACTRDSECGSGNVCSPFSSTCIEDPSVSSCVASIWTGAGHYGTVLHNGISLQADPVATRTTIATFDTTGGTENLYSSLQGLVDPASISGETGCTGPMAGFIGCPSFRNEAVRILVTFTDEDSDAGTLAGAATALSGAGVTMIGVWSGTTTDVGRAALLNVVRDSGSLGSTGMPLIFDGANAAVVEAAVTPAINEVVEGVPLRVTIASADEPGDDGDSLQFIQQLVTNTTGIGCTAIATEDADRDGIPETYPSVIPGTPVCWDVVAAMNVTVMPAASPLVFRARLTVSGDGSPLDSRLVFFLVPPFIPDPGGPD